jgi:plastocyanin
MSSRQRLTFGLLAALIAAVAVFVLAGSGDDVEQADTPTATATAAATAVPQEAEPIPTEEAAETPTAEATPESVAIRYRSGEVQGGVKEIEASKGDTVRFTVSSDVADEVHVHGYDLTRDIPAGGMARISFTAKITGVFEIELEGAHVPVGSLKVSE